MKTEFKTSIGAQAGVETPFGEVTFAPVAVVVIKDNMSFKSGKMTEHTGSFLNMDLNKKTGQVTNSGSVEIESKFGIQAAKSGGEVGQTFRAGGSEAQLVPGSNSTYTKTSIFGLENKTSTNSNGSKTQTKSFDMSWGAQFIAGFEFNLHIERKDK